MPARPSIQQWYGTLIHLTLERAGRLRIAGEAVDDDRLAALWQEAWEAARGPKGAFAELRTHGEETLRRYAASPGWRDPAIAAVESAFELPVDSGRVSGRFDRIDNGGDAVPTVVDYKTGPPPSGDTAARDLQVRAYAVALAQRQRTDSVAVELHHLQTAEVTRVELDSAQLKRAFGHVSATAADVVRAWADGEFPPNPSPWRCRRCDYRTICDERSE
jgi:DNA helicase-2/ATP-dependent DNA helicase PcrA